MKSTIQVVTREILIRSEPALASAPDIDARVARANSDIAERFEVRAIEADREGYTADALRYRAEAVAFRAKVAGR